MEYEVIANSHVQETHMFLHASADLIRALEGTRYREILIEAVMNTVLEARKED